MVEFVRALVGICKLKMEDVKKWLIGLNLVSYYDGFIENGYDDLDAIKCLEDEDLDAIGVIDPTHRQMIKSGSQQEEEQATNEDLDALNFDNVLNDLDSIIDQLGAFGNPASVASKPVTAPKPTVALKPTPAPKPTAKSSAATVFKDVEENSTTVESRTSSVFVETETGQTRVKEPAEDFDLDSLLYDIVKFDPSKVVQQQQQQETQPQQLPLPVTNNVQQEDVPDSGGVPEQQSPQDESVETFKMPDFRSASTMISDEEVKQRLNKLTEELQHNHALTEEEIQQKIKDEKLRIALEKMKLANIKKVAVKVFNADGSSKTVVIEEGMTAAIVCHMLVVKNNAQENPKWALIEKWEELGIERVIEDHEIVVDIYSTWPRQNSNTFVFKLLETKYDLFEKPIDYFPSHLSLSAESAYKHGAQERAEKARKILLQEYFSSTHRVPEIEGILYSKEGYKKPWKKYFFILRSSGLYYSTKGKSKLPKNLRVFVQFEGHDVYYGVGLKKLLAAPSDFCFCLKASIPATPSMTSRDGKVFCAESEQLLKTWVAGIRLAKYGLQLKDNYHKSHVTQFKLEEFESGGEHTVEQQQQKLTGMIVEHHLDKIRHEYQQQHEKQEQVLQQEKEQQRLQQQQEQQRLLQQQEQQRLLQQQEQQRLLQQQEQQRLLQQQEQQRLLQQEQQRLLQQQEQQRLLQQQEQQRLLQQQEQQRLLQQQQREEQEQRLQNQLVKQMSAPVPPVRPSVSRTNTDNTASSPVHRSRVLPPIPTRQTPAVSINQPPTSFSSPYPPGFSTSAPVANSHFVPTLSQQPFSLQSFPWYHGDISRDIAVKRLEEFSMKDGSFLIRQSKSCVGTYVLTMAAEGIIRNFQIQPHSSGSAPVLYRIDDGPEFSTIQQLIDHYTYDADRLPCKLSCFCPK